MDVNALLEVANERNASDLHLIAKEKPAVRIDGKLVTLDSEFVSDLDVSKALLAMANNEQHKVFAHEHELDFAWVSPNGTRLRINACRQKGTVGLVFRIVRNTPPSIEELGLLPICKNLVTRKDGLILVSGPASSGKSTTMAAMIEHLNQNYERCIITVEDPIEYEYSNKKSVIVQREVGSDTHSFATALQHVLHQDPDVILVGEIRDAETASMVLMAAETGHLVLSTIHASSAQFSIESLSDFFPSHQQSSVHARIAAVLQGVLCQSLVPRPDGLGRVAAMEILLTNAAVRTLIRDGKTHQLQNVMHTSQQFGMCTMDQALERLHYEGLCASHLN